MPVPKQRAFFENVHFWLLTAFLILAFLTGGGSRPDVQSLVILRPIAVLVIGFALAGMTWDQLRRWKPLAFLLGSCLLICVVHLIPLPPSVWQLLPGRDIVTQLDKASGLGPVWRPLSLAPWGTLNAFYALAVPMAVFLLLIRMSPAQRHRILVVVIGMGLLSGLIGVLQAVGDPSGPLYFYRVTNNGGAVGLFANRNHQAAFLATLFPMLAVFAMTGVETREKAQFKAVLAVSAAVVVVPLLLVTGSRAGLILGLVGVCGAALIYRRPHISTPEKRRVQRINPAYVLGGIGLLMLIAITILSSRAVAIQRLISQSDEDTRLHIWAPAWDMVGKYFPVGSGIGSFVEVFQVDEPDALLQTSYVNHAHNDFLEVLLTGGLPGLVLLAAAAILILREGLAIIGRAAGSGKSRVYSKLGFLIVAMLSAASVADYPIRTPSLSALFVIALVWLFGARDQPAQ